MTYDKNRVLLPAAIAAAATLAAAGTGVAIAAAPQTVAADEVTAVEAVEAVDSGRVLVHQVVGTFSATQDEAASADQVARTFGRGSYSLCSDVMREESAEAMPAEAVAAWQIKVTGDVQQEYVTTMADIAEKSGATRLMGCTCAGNPAGGLASINAQTTGVSISSMLLEAGIEDGANAVTFVSADGYEVSVPLWSIFTKPALVAYEIAGEPVYQTLGNANQVWLGGASANYFARDVVEIRVESLDQEPAAPGEGIDYATPNVAVIAGVTA